MKVGIVANEFFDLSVGRMGGFGWAARQAARVLLQAHDRGFIPVFLAGENRMAPGRPDPIVHGIPLILRRDSAAEHAKRVLDEGIDLLLSIDYRPHYDALFRLLPETPIIVWVRDPRTPADIDRIRTVRIPGAEEHMPAGLETPACTSLRAIIAESTTRGRKALFAMPAPSLGGKIPSAYGVPPPEVFFLPNVIDLNPGEVVKSPRPSVVFLGRLDPIKRPWLFAELARHFPGVDFIFLGKPHFHGEGRWNPEGLPDNLKWPGHLDGDRKLRVLSDAWVLVNTSIHESLATSFLEALACETPLLASVDGGGVVPQHGIFVGLSDGDGRDSIPGFVAGLSRLLEDGELRTRLGKEGRRWVAETHSPSRFMQAFESLCTRAVCQPSEPGRTRDGTSFPARPSP